MFDPAGNLYAEKEGNSTLAIDVPKAAPGEWKYTVTAISVPSDNFPFRVTVGEVVLTASFAPDSRAIAGN